MVDFLPGNAPYTEAYWEALIREGEHSTSPAPPADPESIWQGLGLEGAGQAFGSRVAASPEGAAAFPDGNWEAVLRAMEEAWRLSLPVVGYNRGGLLVEWDGRQGFVPAAHLKDLPPYLDERERLRALRGYLGQVLHLYVIEADPERNRLVLSERATRAEEMRRRALLEALQPGAICQGRITSICSFGAFVDIGGLEGLVHISEIAWERVEHPARFLRLGQEVEVYVLHVDRERGRVGLSIKRTRPDPWEGIERRYQVGQIVRGVITHVTDFGAFARLEEGVEGLIHLSELAEGHFLHPRNVVHEGQEVTLRVLNVDSAGRRLALSMRQATAG